MLCPARIVFSFVVLLAGWLTMFSITAAAHPQGHYEKLTFSPECATGSPDTGNRDPQITGWIPMPGHSETEWLLLEYSHPVKATRIRIRFSAPQHALIHLYATDTEGHEQEIPWEEKAISPDRWQLETPCSLPNPISKIKVVFDTRLGTVAVDAVGLVTEKEQSIWAVDATASSSKAFCVSDDSRDSADCAEQLLASGSPENIAFAVAHLEKVFMAQELCPQNARYGNFSRSAAIKGVTDNNWACFILYYLVPMMLDHADRLPDAIRDRVHECIRLGSAEIRRLDVAPSYTNISAMTCLTTSLAGEYLGDASLAQYGYARTRAFAEQILSNGAAFEFNAPTYTFVTVAALSRLAHYTHDTETRILARLLETRLVSSYVFHLSPTKGRLAGPYARAYYPSLVGEAEPESEFVEWWIHRNVIPEWIGRLHREPSPSFQITETANKDWNIGMTTFISPEFAMGTATREISRQTAGFTLQYSIPDQQPPGVVYSRYLVDDDWFGSPGIPPNRSDHLFPDDMGMFHGVQEGGSMIGVYTPRVAMYPYSLSPCGMDQKMKSAKAIIVWTHHSSLDGVWLNGEPVKDYPATVAPDSVIVTAMKEVLLAIRPLKCDDLGANAPMRLNVVASDLVLEMYNYLGPVAQSMSIDPMSRFYQGLPRCGFYAEAVARADYPDIKAFSEAVASGTFRNEVSSRFTSYNDNAEQPWIVEYQREQKKVGMKINLLNWAMQQRWNNQGSLGWPAFDSPYSQQNAKGSMAAAGATLKCGKSPAWLCGNPTAHLWIVGYYGKPAPVKLATPDGTVKIPQMGSGILVWDNGSVHLEALDVKGNPTQSLP